MSINKRIWRNLTIKEDWEIKIYKKKYEKLVTWALTREKMKSKFEEKLVGLVDNKTKKGRRQKEMNPKKLREK